MARHRADSGRTDTDADAGAPTCAACGDADPEVRYAHYLTLARQLDFAGIETHLWQSLRERKGFDAEVARGVVEGLMAWVKDQVLSYANLLDEQTGAKLPWWEGRQQTILAMRDATELHAKEAEARQAARAQGRIPRHDALRPLGDTLGTVWREPGDDDLDPTEEP